MDLSKQGKQNSEEAERLARRNEHGRQRRLDETIAEREICLAKRRAKQQTKAAKQESTEETAAEKETHLAKHRESIGNRKKLQKAARIKKLA